jgi:replicative DNA helicase
MNKSIIESIEKLLHENTINEDSRLIEIQQLITHHQMLDSQISESKSFVDLYKNKIECIENNTQTINSIQTGFNNLDQLINGFNLGEFIVFGARPGMGKTSLMINLALNFSKSFPVLYFTFDLSENALSSRIISNLTSIDTEKITHQKLEDKDLTTIQNIENTIELFQLYINEGYSHSMTSFRLHCEKMINEKGVKFIFIDYIQLMSSHKYKNRRELEVSHISRELKRIAKELNVCVIATSQLSRAVEQRGGDKKPILSDLRESGAIEQDADKVIFIYRPEYYGFTQDEDGNATFNLMQLLVVKNRVGAQGTADLYCNLATSYIADYNPTAESFDFSNTRLDELNGDDIFFK